MPMEMHENKVYVSPQVNPKQCNLVNNMVTSVFTSEGTSYSFVITSQITSKTET